MQKQEYYQDEIFTNGKTDFIVDAIWYKGFEREKVEIVSFQNGQTYTYTHQEMLNAINENKIWKKK